MSKIRNASGEDRYVAALAGRLVVAGAVIDIPTEDVYGYTQQAGIWEPVDDDATAATDQGHEAYLERLRATGAQSQAPTEEPTDEAVGEVVAKPGARAGRDEWVAYVLATHPELTADDLNGMGRNEIRDTYKQED